MASSVGKGGHCASCKKPLHGLLVYPHEGKNYCFDCYQEIQNKLLQEINKKQEIYSYIKEIFGVQDIPSSVVDYIDKSIKNDNRSLNGIHYTIYYYYQVLKNIPDISFLTWVLKEKYEDARKYLEEQKAIREKNSNIEINNVPPINIKMKSKDFEVKDKKIKYKMEDL